MASGTKIADMTVGLHFDGSKMYVDMNNITKQAEEAGNKSGDKFSKKMAAAMGAIAGITQQVFAKITASIGESVGRAISRVDTLNNFPKVMNNLGVAAEDSSKVINSLADKLMGLPTALDDAAAAVQRFTSKNNDVKKSEKIFLAVNNAILAGGASADIQATALEQLSQAYAKGKPDMMEWRSLQTAMPAQLNQISKAMLGNTATLDEYLKKANEYADKNPMSSTAAELVEQLEAVKNGTGDMTTALGTSLRTGIISMDEFTDTMIRMNNEGVEGFASFEEQARGATGGIGTALENVKNRMAAALQKIIDSIGQENIANAINNISSAFTKLGGAIAGVINFIKENEWARTALISSLITLGLVVATSVVPAFIAWAGALLANPITWIILGVTALITGLIMLVTHIQEVGQWFSDVFGAIGDFIGEVIDNVGKFIGGVVEKIKKFIGEVGKVVKSIGDFIGTVAQNVANFFVGVFQIFWAGIQPIVDFVRNIVILVIAIVTRIAEFIWNVLIQPIINWATMIYNFWATVFTNVYNFLASVFTNIYNFIADIIGKISAVIGSIVGWIYDNVIIPIGDFFNTLFTWIGDTASNIANGIATVVGNVVGAITTAIGNFANGVKSVFEGIYNFVTSIFSSIGEFIGNVFETIGNIIKAPINGIINAINGVLSGINSITVPDWVPFIGGSHTDFGMIPTLAQGGLATGATNAIIGEAGREVVLPLEQNTGNWSGLLANALAEEMGKQNLYGEKIQVTINNNINNELDAREIGQVMMESIRRAAA